MSSILAFSIKSVKFFADFPRKLCSLPVKLINENLLDPTKRQLFPNNTIFNPINEVQDAEIKTEPVLPEKGHDNEEKSKEENKEDDEEIVKYEKRLKKYEEQLKEFDGEKTDPEYYFFEEELRKDIVNLKNIQADQERKKAVMAALQQLRKDLKNKADPPINNEEDRINYLLRKITFVNKKTDKLRNELDNFKQEMTKDDYYYFNESLMRFMADLDKIDSIKYKAIKEDKRAVITSIKSAQDLLRTKRKINE